MYSISELSKISGHLNSQEQKAAIAQRESIKYKQAEFLVNKIGETFKGVITSVQDFGVFIELMESGCDGMVDREALKCDNLYIDQENFCINDLNNGENYRLGDEVSVKVTNVNLSKKQVYFKIII